MSTIASALFFPGLWQILQGRSATGTGMMVGTLVLAGLCSLSLAFVVPLGIIWLWSLMDVTNHQPRRKRFH